MPRSNQTIPTLQDIVKVLKNHPKRWIIPAVLATVAALAYAVIAKPTWEASQALVLREEAVNSQDRPGRFSSLDDMKTAQETIVELARNRTAVAAALTHVGPPADHGNDKSWPSDRDIERVRKSIVVTAPNGAEFGQTEVIYLSVKDSDRDRAVALTAALCGELENRLQQLRNSKAQSLIDELTRTEQLVRADLDRATQRLAELENEVGSDLAELRILNESASGDSNLRQALIQIENELRQAVRDRDALAPMHQLLLAAREDTTRLVATPNRLLESQPALRRLKEGLIDAQLHTADLSGSMSASHPHVQTAAAAEKEIRRSLHNELEVALRGLTADLQVADDRVKLLETQHANVKARLTHLASVRADYNNLTAETRQRGQTLTRTQQDLTDAHASLQAARATSLITRLDEPAAGNDPLGPRKALIVCFGLAGGLLIGFGIVFLTVPPAVPLQPETALPQPQFAADLHGRIVYDSRTDAAVASSSRGLSLKEALAHIA